MMAKSTVITDDIDGSPNAETIEFSFDGANYSIDMSKKNRAAFEKALKPYLAAATPTARRSRRTASAGAGLPTRRRRSGPAIADVRAWAIEQGIEVSERGRIAQDVIDAYTAAH